MIRLSLLLTILLAASPIWAAEQSPAFQAVQCEGVYPHHLQGVCTDEGEAIFWSFTTKLVRTDPNGKVLKRIDVANHHGDLCYRDGQVFVAVNLGKFNDSQGNADSWIYVYDADDLSLAAKHKTPELIYGAGGVTFHNGKFLVVGGLPAGMENNSVYEYDRNFRFLKQHHLASGYTLMGIQTAAVADGHCWFGCYGTPSILLKVDEAFSSTQRFEFDASLGIVPASNGKFFVARGTYSKETGHTGRLVWALGDKKRGLRLTEVRPPAK